MKKTAGKIDLRIVEAISDSPDSSVKSLAEILDTRVAEVEKRVAFLMRYGLLANKANRKDILELTTKGRFFLEKHDPRIVAGYSPEESVPEYLAFKFAAGEGMMTGDMAHSYQEFLDVIKRVDSRSLVYHLYRGDFDNWVSEVFRDRTLSEKLVRLKSTVRPVNQLRTKMIRVLEGRIAELGGN